MRWPARHTEPWINRATTAAACQRRNQSKKRLHLGIPFFGLFDFTEQALH
jgi:hypothetical protein